MQTSTGMPVDRDDSFDFLSERGRAGVNSAKPEARGSTPATAAPSSRGASNGTTTTASSRSTSGDGPTTKPPVPPAASLPADPQHEFPFLYADHSFDAATLANSGGARDPSSICLSFSEGEVAYVHFVHSSGWGDVTLVSSGERGWIPIDYFSRYCDSRAIPLFGASAAFIARPRSQRLISRVPGATTQYTFSEAAVNEIITTTKTLLMRTNAFSRSSLIVQQFPRVALARKMLLKELEYLVHVAKENKHTTDAEVIDRLVRGAYRMLERAVALMAAVDDPDVQRVASSLPAPPSMPAPVPGSAAAAAGTVAGAGAAGPDAVSKRTSTISARSRSSTRSARSSASTQSSDWESQNDRPIFYRMRSFSEHTDLPRPVARLHEVVSALVSYLDHFKDPSELLANPESPATSPTILAITRHCMLACRELLVVLDVAGEESDTDKDQILEEVRRLVTAARSVVAALPPTPASLRSVATQTLIASATRCYDLVVSVAQRCEVLLSTKPDLSLPEDRSYPKLSENDGDLTMIGTLSGDTTEGSITPRRGSSSTSSRRQSRASTYTQQEDLAKPGVAMARDLEGHIGHPATPNNRPLQQQHAARTSISSMSSPALSGLVDSGSALATTPQKSRMPTGAGAATVRGADALGLQPTQTRSPARSKSYSEGKPDSGSPRSGDEASVTAADIGSPPTHEGVSSSAIGPKDLNNSDESVHINGVGPGQLSPRRMRERSPAKSASVNVASVSSDRMHSAMSGALGDENENRPISGEGDELVYRNGRVRGGTFRALVRWLVEGDADEFERRAFLLTFRLFSEPRDLVIELGTLEPSRGVQHLASLWVESFWDHDDGVIKSLAPIVDPVLISARRKLIATGSKHAQVVEVPLHPPDALRQTSQGSISKGDSSTIVSSASSSTTSLRSISGSSSRNGSHTALNLAASFREFGLGQRRTSRQGSGIDDRWVARARAASQVSLVGALGGVSEGSSSASRSDVADYFLSRSPQDIAQQLTVMWFDIFLAMRTNELIDQRFSSSRRSLGLAPHVNQLVFSSNHLTAFVGDTVLAPDLSLKQRTKVVKHWLRIADELYALGNLNGIVTIVLSLQSSRIARLRRVWESLSAKSTGIMDKLTPLTAPERNFSEYRKELRSRAGQRCIPYIGILLGDLTLIDEGNAKTLKTESGFTAINFDRYRKGANAIASIQDYQTPGSYDTLAPNVTMQSWLRGEMAKSYSIDSRDSEEQWRRSVLIQPD